jgi:hypothetical protein
VGATEGLGKAGKRKRESWAGRLGRLAGLAGLATGCSPGLSERLRLGLGVTGSDGEQLG